MRNFAWRLTISCPSTRATIREPAGLSKPSSAAARVARRRALELVRIAAQVVALDPPVVPHDPCVVVEAKAAIALSQAHARLEVEIRDERVRRPRPRERGIANDQRHADRLLVRHALAGPAVLAEEEAVVGRE